MSFFCVCPSSVRGARVVAHARHFPFLLGRCSLFFFLHAHARSALGAFSDASRFILFFLPLLYKTHTHTCGTQKQTKHSAFVCGALICSGGHVLHRKRKKNSWRVYVLHFSLFLCFARSLFLCRFLSVCASLGSNYIPGTSCAPGCTAVVGREAGAARKNKQGRKCRVIHAKGFLFLSFFPARRGHRVAGAAQNSRKQNVLSLRFALCACACACVVQPACRVKQKERVKAAELTGNAGVCAESSVCAHAKRERETLTARNKTKGEKALSCALPRFRAMRKETNTQGNKQKARVATRCCCFTSGLVSLHDLRLRFSEFPTRRFVDFSFRPFYSYRSRQHMLRSE